MRYAVVGGKQVPIHVAEELRDKGFKRLIDVIDKKSLDSTVDKVAEALQGDKLLSAAQQRDTDKVTITYVIHVHLRDASFTHLLQ